MVTADPERTPTFAMFANPFYWVVKNGATCGGSCSSSDYRELAHVYKQIEAPVGLLGTYTLQASTKALSSDSAGDRTYRSIEAASAELARRRDAIGAQMIALLDGVAFQNERIDPREARQLEWQGEQLIAQARVLANR